MCGIMGYTGHRQAMPIVLDGLSRIEYRGYDSAGIAILGPGGVFGTTKAVGKLDALRADLEGSFVSGTLGLGHTRWATHGAPSLANAHPHMDCTGRVSVVQNGIVENYSTLAAQLTSRGHKFTSQTDTEVLPHLIEEALDRGLEPVDAITSIPAGYARRSGLSGGLRAEAGHIDCRPNRKRRRPRGWPGRRRDVRRKRSARPGATHTPGHAAE